MNKPYKIIGTLPQIKDPLLVVMMTGWIDTSSAAAAAIELVAKETSAVKIIDFDIDTFVDFRARRPIMELRDGVNTKLVWSTPEIALGRDINDKDVLLLTGPEPDTHWNLFAETIADISVQFGVRRMIGIGAYPFATPHTRAVYVSCTSPDKDLVASLPYLKSSVDVPAGMAAAIEHCCTGARFKRSVCGPACRTMSLRCLTLLLRLRCLPHFATQVASRLMFRRCANKQSRSATDSIS